MTYDRSKIMREAGRLMREAGMSRSDAMRAAWATAKTDAGALTARAPKQQEAGLRAALRRYGIDADRIAARAVEAVKAVVAAIENGRRPALLPPPGAAKALDMTRGDDGVYRL